MEKIKKFRIEELKTLRTDVIDEGLTRKLNEIIDIINEKLIPVKIPNPSEKKGFDIKKLPNNLYTSPTYEVSIKINQILDYLSNQANGEKPEVVNTVGQTVTALKDNILYVLRTYTKDPFHENSSSEKYLLDMIVKCFNNSKPVETDKEEPKYFWKLHCKNRDNTYKAPCEIIEKSIKNLKTYINMINNNNYSYIIVDFEQIGL